MASPSAWTRRSPTSWKRVATPAPAGGAEIMRLCAEVGGSISGEHGIGLEKADFMPFIFSVADLEFMRRLKQAFNPTGRCNPGKVFPTRKSCGEAGPVAYRPHPIEEKGLAQRF